MAIDKRKLEGAILMGMGIAMMVGLLVAHISLKKMNENRRAAFDSLHAMIAKEQVTENALKYVDTVHHQSQLCFALNAGIMNALLIVSGITSLMMFWFGQELRNSIPIKKDASRASPETASAE